MCLLRTATYGDRRDGRYIVTLSGIPREVLASLRRAGRDPYVIRDLPETPTFDYRTEGTAS